jgi:CBS domain-containing protein/rubredoxin
MKVKEIMTSDVISVSEESTIEDAARILAHHRISGLPVMNAAGSLIGLVTEYDLISKQGQSIADIMSRGVISVTEDTDVEEVSHLLTNRRIRRVPVLRGDQLVGIVSRSDLVRQIAMRWVCPVCGEVVRGPAAPEQCPRCHAPKRVFTHETMNPGM